MNMDKQEYEEAKSLIIAKHGKPEYDFGTPVNDSAKLLTDLRYKQRVATRQKNKLEEAEEIAVADSVTKHSRAIEITLTESDLVPFDDVEQRILLAHFANTNLSHKEIAVKANSTAHKVALLFRSGRYKVLSDKVFNSLAPMEAKAAVLKAMRAGNTQVTLRVAEHFKVLQSESIELKKPIEDPELIRKLKEMGDQQ